MVDKVVVHQKMSMIHEHWRPRMLGELNDHHVKIVKFQGDFVWHKHDDTDEMFFVIAGSFVMQLRDGDIELQQGDFIIIPAGVEHCPTAMKEVQVMLIERAGTLNTGDAPASNKTAHDVSPI